MELRVLGALTAHENGAAVKLGGRQQRLVLALLCAHPNEAVSLDRILDDMWGEEVPASARKAVQGYVSNLRKSLGAETIGTEPNGYRLIATAANLDALAFEGSLAAARVRSDPAQRRAALVEALAMWTGRPYEDLEDAEPLAAEIERLAELRLTASEDLIEIDIDRGRATEAIPEIGSLTSAHPFRERTRGLQMRALYSAGRQSEALQAYQDLRHALATEIGVEPSAALKGLEAQILSQDESLDDHSTPQVALKPANPFRGLRPFDERSGDQFFGRDALVRRLVEHMDQSRAARLTLVAGASGAGKSSVVRAGLVPALKREGRSTRTAIVSDDGIWIGALLECSDDVIVLDQLESGLTTPAVAARTLAVIADHAQRPGGPWIVATVRADYLDVLLSDPAIGLLVEPALVLVPPMDDRELTEAIVEPAARVGVRVAEGLTHLLVADMRERAAGLPLLQYALTETYEAGELSVDNYRSVGGLGGALARRAEALIQQMSEERRDLLRTCLLRLVALGADGQPSLQRHAVADLTADQREVLELFGSHRMVTFDGGDAASVSIAHEALVRDWPLFARWIEDARDDLVGLRRLSLAARDWHREGRPASLLFGPALANRYDERLEVQATAGDIEFLAASRSAAASDLQRRRWIRRAAVGAIGAVAILAAVLAVFARSDRQEADAQREEAEAQRLIADIERADAERRALVSEALLQAGSDPVLGLLLAIEAYALDPTLESVRPVLSVLGRFSAEPVIFDDFAGRFDLTGSISDEFGIFYPTRCSVEVEPGTFLVATEGEEFAFIESVKSLGRIIDSSAYGCQISLDSTGTLGLGRRTSFRGTTLFDLTSGDVQASSAEIEDAHFVGDGRILGFANEAGTGRIVRDQSTQEELLWADPSLTKLTPTGVMATAIYPDRLGSLIVLSDAVMGSDGERASDVVRRYVVDARDLSIVHDLGVVEWTPAEVTWSRDGTLFGDVSKSGRLRVWDARSGELVTDGSVDTDIDLGAWISFSPSNDQVALVLRSGGVSIRPLNDPARPAFQVRRPSAVNPVEAADASFIDPDTIAVLLDDGTIEVTNLRRSALAAETIPNADPVPQLVAARWAVEGRSYVLTNASEIVEVAGSERRSTPLLPRESPAVAGITATSRPDRVHVWAGDLGSPAEPGSFHTVEVDLIALSPVGPSIEIGLFPGTELAVGLRDRVVAQNLGGTIFQFGYNGDRLASRVDLSFSGAAIAQSPSSSRALVAGSGQLALVDLDTGDIIDQIEANVSSPLAFVSEELAVIGRVGGDIELWSVTGLEGIGPVVPLEKRSQGETLTVTTDGDLWYHSAQGSQQIVIDGATLVQTACRLAGRSLTNDEWRRHVSTEDAFTPVC